MEDYPQMLSLSSNLHKSFNSDPVDYLKRTRDESMHRGASKHARLGPGGGARPPIRESAGLEDRRHEHKGAKRLSKRPAQARKPTHTNIPSSVAAADRMKPPHTRAPSVKRPEDIHFELLQDFSPPTSTLPANNKSLKIEWSSHNPLDLSTDPHRHLLHEAEVALASTLRLNCATYLCSKRRIFLRLREAFQAGKEFRKTDAQQACQIDVNKASKLWVAFEKVGWFDRDHFTQQLTPVGPMSLSA